MSDGMRRELAYLSSHATNRYFIPNWGIYSKNGTLGTRPVHITGDSKLFPFFVTLVQAFGSEDLFLLGTHFVVGYHNTTAMTAIFLVQKVDSMKGCATARKEIENEGVGFVGYKETDGIMDGVQGLGEFETLFT